MQNKWVVEFFGTAVLLFIITGSGIMAESLSAHNVAVALLGNSIATGCALYVLITLLEPVSGAHFNPAVSFSFWYVRDLSCKQLWAYLAAQFSGAITGVWLTHVVFNLAVIQTSSKLRNGVNMWVSELAATLILLFVIHLGIKYAKDKIPMLVALTVTAGYWFTASTFFANPAVTLARSLTDTFVGIQPSDVLGFIVSQCVAVIIFCLFIRRESI